MRSAISSSSLLPGQANPLEGDRAIAYSLTVSPPPQCPRKQCTRPEPSIVPEATMQRVMVSAVTVPPASSKPTDKTAHRSEGPITAFFFNLAVLGA
jgi:hypothetical protein